MSDEETEHQRFNDKLEDVQDRVRELEITLHGKRAKTGLLAEYERHDQLLARLYAVIWQDPTGQKGILHDIDILMDRRSSKDKSTPFKWQFWGLILATVITSLTALITQWDKIMKALPIYPQALENKIEKGRHPRGKKVYRYHVIEPPSPDTKESPEKKP